MPFATTSIVIKLDDNYSIKKWNLKVKTSFRIFKGKWFNSNWIRTIKLFLRLNDIMVMVIIL